MFSYIRSEVCVKANEGEEFDHGSNRGQSQVDESSHGLDGPIGMAGANSSVTFTDQWGNRQFSYIKF